MSLTNSRTSTGEKNKILLGFIVATFFIFFILLSLPVYIIRILVKSLAKHVRPDLGEMLNGSSAIFINDYFAQRTSRANIVVKMVIQGQLTLEETKHLVMKNWITARDSSTGDSSFSKFQQYPVRWLGFTFWKDAFHTFSVDNHVHRIESKDEILGEEDLENIVEKLMNTRFSPEQSPWALHVIENFKIRNIRLDGNNQQQTKSVLIFHVHHSLADGFSILTALLQGLSNHLMDNVTIPVPRLSQRSFWKKLVFLLTGPIYGFSEMSYLLTHLFKLSPLKAPDEIKEWYQVCANTDPISIQLIKDIKNSFGVTFSSVLLSAISAGIYKTLEHNKSLRNYESDWNDSILCISVLPIPGYGRNRNLTNQLTGAPLEIPTKKFQSPVDRLRAIHDMFENAKKSMIPIVIQSTTNIVGSHFYAVAKMLAKNRMASIGLTNFPGMLEKVELSGKPLIDVDFMVGAQDGVAGVIINALSYNQQIRLGITAEKALMSRKDAKRFLTYVTDEIQLLRSLMTK